MTVAELKKESGLPSNAFREVDWRFMANLRDEDVRNCRDKVKRETGSDIGDSGAREWIWQERGPEINIFKRSR